MQQSPSPRVLILVASGPSTPARCAAPFHIATLLACMDAEVTLYLTGEATQLAHLEVAATLCAVDGANRCCTLFAMPKRRALGC